MTFENMTTKDLMARAWDDIAFDSDMSQEKRATPRKGLSRPHSGGAWTEARKKSFIMSALRSASRRWNPRNQCKKDAKIGRWKNPKTGRNCNVYQCSKCQNLVYGAANLHADHISPVVPLSGWDSWDGVIERMFPERSGFQALCCWCHSILTKQENQQRKKP